LGKRAFPDSLLVFVRAIYYTGITVWRLNREKRTGAIRPVHIAEATDIQRNELEKMILSEKIVRIMIKSSFSNKTTSETINTCPFGSRRLKNRHPR